MSCPDFSYRKLTTRLLFRLVISIPMLVLLQNCSKTPSQFEDQQVKKTMDFFEYRYVKATPIYFEIQIVPDTSDATNQLYKLLGFATNSDAVIRDIEYTIEVFGVNNDSICSLRTGTLTGGQTLVEETCLLPKTTLIKTAVIKVRHAGEDWLAYTKAYQ